MPPITPRLIHMSEHLAAMEFASTVCLAKKQRDQTGSSRSLPSRLEKRDLPLYPSFRCASVILGRRAFDPQCV